MHRITNTGRVNLGHLFWLRSLANMHRGWAAFTVIIGLALAIASGYHFTLHPVD